MKKYYIINKYPEDEFSEIAGELYVAESDELKPVWKSILRHEFQHSLTSHFAEAPKLRAWSMYGLLVDYADGNSIWSVSADNVVRYLTDGSAQDAAGIDLFGVYD